MEECWSKSFHHGGNRQKVECLVIVYSINQQVAWLSNQHACILKTRNSRYIPLFKRDNYIYFLCTFFCFLVTWKCHKWWGQVCKICIYIFYTRKKKYWFNLPALQIKQHVSWSYFFIPLVYRLLQSIWLLFTMSWKFYK